MMAKKHVFYIALGIDHRETVLSHISVYTIQNRPDYKYGYQNILTLWALSFRNQQLLFDNLRILGKKSICLRLAQNDLIYPSPHFELKSKEKLRAPVQATSYMARYTSSLTQSFLTLLLELVLVVWEY